MSKSLADNPFITEAKDKNGDSWYHQIVLELKDKEIERLKSIIKEVREYATQHMMELAKRKGINGEENGAIYVAVADLVEILDKGE